MSTQVSSTSYDSVAHCLKASISSLLIVKQLIVMVSVQGFEVVAAAELIVILLI